MCVVTNTCDRCNQPHVRPVMNERTSGAMGWALSNNVITHSWWWVVVGVMRIATGSSGKAEWCRYVQRSGPHSVWGGGARVSHTANHARYTTDRVVPPKPCPDAHGRVAVPCSNATARSPRCGVCVPTSWGGEHMGDALRVVREPHTPPIPVKPQVAAHV